MRDSTSASAIFGVIMRAIGINRLRIARSPFGPISSAPLLDTITGSTTGGGSLSRLIARPPPDDCSVGKRSGLDRARVHSSASVSICASTIAGLTVFDVRHPELFCAITSVMTE